MIRKFLIFLLYLQLTNAEGELDYLGFKNLCREKGGELLGWPKKTICVPSQFQSGLQHPPNLPQTKVNFYLHKIQVIKIEANSITIRLVPIINWREHRLELITGSQSIYLSEYDQKRIWSPKFFVNDVMSFDVEHEEFILTKNDTIGNVLGTKFFWSIIKVECKMDFLNFPFDEHLCIIEVSFYALEK